MPRSKGSSCPFPGCVEIVHDTRGQLVLVWSLCLKVSLEGTSCKLVTNNEKYSSGLHKCRACDSHDQYNQARQWQNNTHCQSEQQTAESLMCGGQMFMHASPPQMFRAAVTGKEHASTVKQAEPQSQLVFART